MGFIIVIEGCDGSGKQVQTKKLYDRLKEKILMLLGKVFLIMKAIQVHLLKCI